MPQFDIHDGPDHFNRFVADSECPVIVTVDSAGRRELLSEQLSSHGSRPQAISGLAECTDLQPGLYVCVAPLHQGFSSTDPALRLREAESAVKLVYASTFYRGAKSYMASTGNRLEEEKMAVILQEVKRSRTSSLPTVRATWRATYRPGEHLKDRRLVGGLRLLKSLQGAPQLREVGEVTVEADGNYILKTGARVVRLGPGETLLQLDRLDVVLRQRGQELESFAYVDLRFPGRVILKPLKKGG